MVSLLMGDVKKQKADHGPMDSIIDSFELEQYVKLHLLKHAARGLFEPQHFWQGRGSLALLTASPKVTSVPAGNGDGDQ